MEKEVLDQLDDLADEWKRSFERRADIDSEARELIHVEVAPMMHRHLIDYYNLSKELY